MQQPLYGLIGGKLGHSYSKIIHEQIADYTYDLLPLPTGAEARAFMEKRAFAAINVTIPYKQLVIPYCDEVDPKAKAIGAVNTIVNRDGKLYGYNTDYAGFAYLAKAHGVDFADKTVLILGTGGTHSTVAAVCRDGGAKEILTASRTGKDGALLYSEAMHRRDVQIIVNTTPCGMFPNVGQCLIDPKAFPALEAVLDVVYNPFRTELLLRAEDCGVTCGAAALAPRHCSSSRPTTPCGCMIYCWSASTPPRPPTPPWRGGASGFTCGRGRGPRHWKAGCLARGTPCFHCPAAARFPTPPFAKSCAHCTKR